MPKENTMLWLYPDGNVRVWRQDIDHDEWKTAIEVPTPHGRLIDADKLLKLLIETFGEEVKDGFAWKAIESLAVTSTVIEEEE